MAGMYSLAKTGHGVCMHAMRCPRKPHNGHPLGGGHPERVLQEFCNAFHSVREDQSDIVPDFESETEEEEWDDIVTYETETSRCTMVAERDCCIVCNHHRTNKQRCCEWHLGYGKPKRLSLLIF